MRLLINNKAIDFENKENSIELIFEKIERVMSSTQLRLSHLIIDGIEVFDQYKEYLLDHIAMIENVEVILKPIKELINNLFLSTEEYIERVLPEFKILINEFYQGPTEQTWNKFNDFLNGIQWINQLIQTVDQGSNQPDNWDKYLIAMTTIQIELKNLEGAVGSSDFILMADILQYEIMPQLENFKAELGISIDEEGNRNHVN